jgi:eukaryotic-like serine/threonine-protein kinase
MSAPSHDRNLLFGILAVQMDFISRDALVTGMNAWVITKNKLLGEILVEQKAMSADRRTLLEALVNEHLKQHDNDPGKSLAAVSSLGSVKEDLKKIPDADVQASLVHVAETRAPDIYATMVQSSVGSSTSSGSRFRILRPHARGGLGQVSVARDEELHREVALKEIQERHADNPESRARFMLEAEITGGLEHPGIVPVYGLGQYADGRPYYAMRFIRGDSLQEAAQRFHSNPDKQTDSGERALEFRALLGRFIDVCNAIAYAHSRGVLHRDLKPGNIMLGQYGETLVVDWGLAKAQDSPGSTSESVEGPIRPSSISGSSATMMGSAIGTPQYMSPEQAAGRLDLLGPAADVYSLGATLYFVLAGCPPFTGAGVEGILRNVERGEFPPPRAINDQIARPLDAICLKAMALKPEDRYKSPKELAGDIEHWLADEPVSAYREGLPAKAARWARKHRTLVVSSFALVAVAAIALGVTTVLVKRQQLLTEAARLQAVEARKQADAARETAQRRFRLALDALNDMVQGIQTKLEVRPGTEDLRMDLLENARKRVQELLQEAERQGNPDQTLVWSYFRMGDVDQVIGDTAAARKEYARAAELAEKLAAADPNNSSALSDQGISYINLGMIEQQLGQTQAAFEHYQKALAIRKHRVELDPKDPKAQRGLSISYEKLGNVTMQLGRSQDALDFYRQAAMIRQALADADAANLQAQYDLSVILERLGNVTILLGQTSDAADFYRKDQAIRERLAKADPTNTEAQRNLSVSYDRLGDAFQRLGKPAESQDFYRKALTICETLAEADPKNARVQMDLSISYDKLGDATARLNQAKEAGAFYEKSRAIRERLAAASPANMEVQRNLTVSYNKLGAAALQSGQNQEALGFYRKALAIREHLAAADAKSAQFQRDLGSSFEMLGDVTLRLGRNKESLDFYQKALAIDVRLAAADRKSVEAQRDLLMGYMKIGKAAQAMQNSVKAREWYEKALDVAKRFEKPDFCKNEVAEIQKLLTDLGKKKAP